MPVKRKSVAMENDGEFSSFLREHKLEMRESHFHVQSSARFKFEAKAAAGGIDCESFAQGTTCDLFVIMLFPTSCAHKCMPAFE